MYADCYYENEKGMILKSKMNMEEIVSNTARVTDQLINAIDYNAKVTKR
jgi:hypothetical protein